jgi:hypothetical protein
MLQEGACCSRAPRAGGPPPTQRPTLFAALESQRTFRVGAKCIFRTAKTLTPNTLPHHRTRVSTALIPSMAESALHLVSEIGAQLGRQTRSGKDSILKSLKVSRYCCVCVQTTIYMRNCSVCVRLTMSVYLLIYRFFLLLRAKSVLVLA